MLTKNPEAQAASGHKCRSLLSLPISKVIFIFSHASLHNLQEAILNARFENLLGNWLC
jgi:hypothetical protein